MGQRVCEHANRAVMARYAQAIREGLWQCGTTGEPWCEGAESIVDIPHVHGVECCDTRTDDSVEVIG
jgi:hypothetical protein